MQSKEFLAWAGKVGSGTFIFGMDDQEDAVVLRLEQILADLSSSVVGLDGPRGEIRIESAILASMEANAFVRAHQQGLFFIGINVGRVRQLVAGANALYPETSADNQRSRAWTLESGFAFVLDHEFTHAKNGHVDLGQASLSFLDKQTLEMDADAGAFLNLMRWRLELSQHRLLNREAAFMIPESMAQGRFTALCSQLGASTYMAIKVTELEGMPTAESLTGTILQRSHPPAVVRYQSLSGHFATTIVAIANLGESMVDHCVSAFFDGAIKAEKALAQASGRAVDWSFMKSSNQDAVELYGSAIMSNWTDLRPRLQQLKYKPGELAEVDSTWAENLISKRGDGGLVAS